MSDVFGIGGAAQAVGSVASAAIQASAVSDASKRAQESADKAQALLQGRYDTSHNDLAPFIQTGQAVSGILRDNIAAYGDGSAGAYLDRANSDFNQQEGYTGLAAQQYGQAANLGSGPGAQAALEATPGYQFTRAQGLQAVQNSASARGLGVSGAAMKGAAAYATGLADQTYGNQFNRLLESGQASQSIGGNYGSIGTSYTGLNTALQGNLQNSFNRLLSVSGQGESAAAQAGTTGATLGNAAANAAIAGGAAGAAGSIGVGNALAGGINGVTNAFSQNQAQQAYGNTDAAAYQAGVAAQTGNNYNTNSSNSGLGAIY